MAAIKSEAFEALKEYLVQNHNAKLASGGREIIKRCHICGDSRDKSDAHMYIGVNNGVIVYNCFKCNAGGAVDGKFLRDMDIYDPNIINLVQDQNKSSSSSNMSQSGSIGNYKKRVMMIPMSDNEYAQKKLAYLNNRLGINFTQGALISFKIILNLKDFLNANGITRYTRHPDLVDLLDKFFIGFLSMDNNYVILRRLVPEGKLPQYIDTRYVNYNIFGSNSASKFYVVPTEINPTLPIRIHVAEGCFDAISIANHNMMTAAEPTANNIFAAVSGKSYVSIIQFFINTFGFINFELNIYPDNDVSDTEMQRIANILAPFYIQTYIHRNNFPGEKDFGVSMDRIDASVYEI